MSLITQCPACSTMFRVVPDQLRVSEGWVRCGECDEVFDANAHLRLAEEASPAPAMVLSRPSADDETTPQAAPEAEPVSFSIQAEVRLPEPVPVPEENTAAPAIEAAVPDTLLQERPAAPPVAEDTPSPFALHVSALGELVEPAPPAEEALRYVQADAPLPASAADLSFMRKHNRRTTRHRHTHRRLLVLASVLAAATLVFQATVFERERIAAIQPALQPALTALCDVLGCKLHGLQQMDALLIDSSGFSKVRAEAYRLSFNLRNAGALTVATPALELTLTDNQDQPVLRRVLLPSDFAAHQPTLAAGAELGVAISVAVDLRDGEKFSGYRLLAFYP